MKNSRPLDRTPAWEADGSLQSTHRRSTDWKQPAMDAETQLKHARRKARRAHVTQLSSIGVGAIAAGLVAAYVTSGLGGVKSLLLREVIVAGATAMGGLLAGTATSHAVRQTIKEVETIRARSLDLETQANRYRGLNNNARSFVDELVKTLDASDAPAAAGHAARITRVPSISQRAAANATASHVDAVENAELASAGKSR